MADINNVINVSVIPEGRTAARDNLNVVTIMTPQTGFLSSSKRYEIYTGADDVAQDFGSASAVAAHARTFFATRPNPVDAGGLLIVGYHRAAEETIDATAANLKGAEVDENEVVNLLQGVEDGSFDIDIDGTTSSISGLNFQTATSLNDVLGVLQTAFEVSGATIELDSMGFVVTSETSGELSTLTFATDSGAGTYVGEILGLAEGTGAVLTQGEASSTLPAESQLEALQAVRSQIKFFGVTFVNALAEPQAIAEWAQANSVLPYEVFTGSNALEVSTANPVWQIRQSGLTNFRMLHSKVNNRRLATSYMARNHTVNFGADNSTITMHLKELAVPSEDYSQSELEAAKTVGLDVYTNIKQTPVVITSPGNDFVDNRYNLIGYIDAAQTELFNLLSTVGTKVPQTTSGVNSLVDAGESVSRQFVNNRFLAPGAWSIPVPFGDRDTFLRSIQERGFYWVAGSLIDQPQSERQERKSPVLQNAIKYAGATHSADVVINFNL